MQVELCLDDKNSDAVLWQAISNTARNAANGRFVPPIAEKHPSHDKSDQQPLKTHIEPEFAIALHFGDAPTSVFVHLQKKARSCPEQS